MYNMDEAWEHGKWTKPITKDHVLYCIVLYCTVLQVQKKKIRRDRKISGCLRLGLGRLGVTFKEYGVSFGGDEMS